MTVPAFVRDDADGLAEAMFELLWRVCPDLWLKGHGRWYLGSLDQDTRGRWGAMLQGPSRAKQIRSNGNCPTAAAAIRDLCAKVRAGRLR